MLSTRSVAMNLARAFKAGKGWKWRLIQSSLRDEGIRIPLSRP